MIRSRPRFASSDQILPARLLTVDEAGQLRLHDGVTPGGVVVGSGGTPTVSTPTFSPPTGTTFNGSVEVTISCSTPSATIHYTTDGSTPDETDPTYSAPITVSVTTTIRAIGIRSGYTDSAVGSATFTRQTTASPAFAPDGGSFEDSVDVTITCATPGAAIRYTLDGSTPSSSVGTVYSGPITITDTTTIKAIAYASGFNNSSVVTKVFTKDTVDMLYWGVSVNATLDEAGIQGLTNSADDSDPAGSYDFSPGSPEKYLFFCWPNDLALQPVSSTGFVTGGLPMVGDFADTAPYSQSENGWPYAIVSVGGRDYRVYRTRYTQGSDFTITVTAA